MAERTFDRGSLSLRHRASVVFGVHGDNIVPCSTGGASGVAQLKSAIWSPEKRELKIGGLQKPVCNDDDHAVFLHMMKHVLEIPTALVRAYMEARNLARGQPATRV